MVNIFSRTGSLFGLQFKVKTKKRLSLENDFQYKKVNSTSVRDLFCKIKQKIKKEKLKKLVKVVIFVFKS